jgi:hypothetical protein
VHARQEQQTSLFGHGLVGRPDQLLVPMRLHFLIRVVQGVPHVEMLAHELLDPNKFEIL